MEDSLLRREALSLGITRELDAARRELERADRDLDRSSEQLEAATAQLHAALEQRDASQEQLRTVEQHQRQRAIEQQARIRELEQLNSTLTGTLIDVKRDLERAAASRAWRWGHLLTTVAWRLRRRPIRTQGALPAALRRLERGYQQARALPAAAEAMTENEALRPVAVGPHVELPLEPDEEAAVQRYRAALAGRLRERLGPPPSRETWPSVTAIVVTRDGRPLLERLIAGLIGHTDYPALEVVVVDNGSSDGSLEYLEGVTAPFALHVIAAGESLSFAEANARGVARAAGDLLLFLNNDVEPFETGWLKELVVARDVEDVEAAGATLIHAEPPGAPLEAEPLVQHRAIAFRWQHDTVRGFNVGDGELLWEDSFGIERRCAAVTAACLLIARGAYDRCGGFHGAYRFGTEDVDLGLKLVTQGAQLVGVGRSVLVHRESSSQMRADSDFRRVNRTGNRRVLLERWGPRLLRSYRLARLGRDRFWTDGVGPHVAITVTNLDPRAGWGDWYTAHELGDALEALGWRVSYVQRKGDDWYSLPDDLDYVLALMDPFDLRRVPEHVTTIAWIRNWTERWLERPWFERIDVLLTSSGPSAELIEQATGRPSTRFPLATNPARFAEARSEPALACDYAYTGNRWGERRAIETAVAPRTGERFRVYGRGWHEIKRLQPYDQGPVEYERLPAVYASAKLVLDDTQEPTLPYGALNARVLDALAAGALPVTDCVTGARELFDSDFPVWSSAGDLRSRLDGLLGDERLRRSLGRRYRTIVLQEHTYAHRAEQLRRVLMEHEHRLSFVIKIGAPDRAAADRWGDLHFAQALARELQRRGHRTLVQTLDEWESESGLRRDVVLHLKGLTRYHPKPGQFNVLWSISHPAELTAEECDGFDLVCVASSPYAVDLQARTDTPVVVLEQATDPWVFHPDPRPDLAHQLVYVANSRNVLRPMMRDLLPTERELAVWGANWGGLIDGSLVVGEHIPNDELRHVYSSAEIVLCDHWDDMREHGYISNRVFDALACGAFVISDDVTGLKERFGDALATYRTKGELKELIEGFLGDPAERQRRAQRGRALVLERHTFADVSDVLLREIGSRIADAPRASRPQLDPELEPTP